jgi:hypothetical protein
MKSGIGLLIAPSIEAGEITRFRGFAAREAKAVAIDLVRGFMPVPQPKRRLAIREEF